MKVVKKNARVCASLDVPRKEWLLRLSLREELPISHFIREAIDLLKAARQKERARR